MDIKEVREEKRLLEKKIFKLLEDFENKSGVSIKGIDITCNRQLGQKSDICDVDLIVEI